MLKRKGFDYDQNQATEILMKRAVYGDVIQNWHKYADGLQTIIYCSSIKHSKATAAEFRMAGIEAVHFDGDTSSTDRRNIVADFRSGKILVLCNVDLVGEGFDVPGCWCCVLLRPTMSTGLFIQQSGRALRPQNGKTAIIIDHVGNYTRHGLPADYRDWSLKTSIKPLEEYSEDGRLTVRQCPYCYYTFKTGPDCCPSCGELIKSTRKEIENIQAIELQEITEHQQKQKRIEVGRAKSYAELRAIEKQRGYKPGWAWIRAKQRGYKC
jgi:superfamily II DNA or RNA helicase